MISIVQWVRRGVFAQVPQRYEPQAGELERAMNAERALGAGAAADADDDADDYEDVDDEMMEATATPKKEKKKEKAREQPGESGVDARAMTDADVAREFDMDNYDDDDDDTAAAAPLDVVHDDSSDDEHDGGTSGARGMLPPLSSLPADMATLREQLEEEEDEEDLDNFLLQPTDIMLLAAASDEDDCSHLDVFVYEEAERNMYIHHDILLPSFPLALAWMNAAPGLDVSPTSTARANYLAIGTFQPGIELWNLDCVDALEPNAVLGGTVGHQAGGAGAMRTLMGEHGDEQSSSSSSSSSKKAKKRNKQKAKKKAEAAASQLVDGSHTDAVISLSWNANERAMLASGSADTTVKLWDVTTCRCTGTAPGGGKVQCVEWHPVERSVLAAGTLGGAIGVFDVRSPDEAARWQLGADIEALHWAPGMPHVFVASLDDGRVLIMDARTGGSAPMLEWQAHAKATTAVSINAHVANYVATASLDKSVKLWSLADGGAPTCVHEQNLDLGKVFTLAWCPDSPFSLAVGGNQERPIIWNTLDVPAVAERFDAAATAAAAAAAVTTTAATASSSSSSSKKPTMIKPREGGSSSKKKKSTAAVAAASAAAADAVAASKKKKK